MGDEAVSVVVPWVICCVLVLILIATWWLTWRESQAMLNWSQSLELAKDTWRDEYRRAEKRVRELEAERDLLRSDLEAAQSKLDKIGEYVSSLESKRIAAQ